MLIKIDAANSLIEDYAACLEVRLEEGEAVENSCDDLGVLIMQVSFIDWLFHLLKYHTICTTASVVSAVFHHADSSVHLISSQWYDFHICSFWLIISTGLHQVSHICFLNLILMPPWKGQFCSQSFITGLIVIYMQNTMYFSQLNHNLIFVLRSAVVWRSYLKCWRSFQTPI